MGIQDSKLSSEGTASALYLRLFEEVSVFTNSGVQVVNQKNFEALFGGPCLEFGQCLYKRLFEEFKSPVTKDIFFNACQKLEKIASYQENDTDTVKFLFTVLSNGEYTLPEQDLEGLIVKAMGYSLVMGTSSHEEAWSQSIPELVKWMAKNLSYHVDRDTREISKGRFAVWLSHHSPRMLLGIQLWLASLLHGHQVSGPTSADKSWQLLYQLPHLTAVSDKPSLMDTPLIWALSTNLPLCYLGRMTDQPKSAVPSYPVGCEWTQLYNSRQHGFGLNRFMHHSSDYKDPTITVLQCHAATGDEFIFVMAVDTDWKEGAFFWGKENCCLIQIKPDFQKITCGPKLLCLNEKSREFPKGLRFMAPSDGPKIKSHLYIEEDFSSVHLFDGKESVTLVAVEVWGCGDVSSIEQQQRWKEWESKEVQRRRKIKKESLEDWKENPDRAILEWGGIVTTHPKEQQQE